MEQIKDLCAQIPLSLHQRMRNRRCAIPAKVFYEWDRQKHLTTFSLPDQSLIWMAGIYDLEYRFSVLTTAANESVGKIHDRMPLILKREDLRQWLFDFDAVQDLLEKKMPALRHRQDYEQTSLL